MSRDLCPICRKKMKELTDFFGGDETTVGYECVEGHYSIVEHQQGFIVRVGERVMNDLYAYDESKSIKQSNVLRVWMEKERKKYVDESVYKR